MFASAKKRPDASQSIRPIPTSLIGREALAALRAQLTSMDPDWISARKEPDWEVLRAKWQRRHNLDDETGKQLAAALERLWLLPFRRYEACSALMIFRFVNLPAHAERFRKDRDQDGMILVRAFQTLVEVMLQGLSVLPGDPVHLAQQIMSAILSPVEPSRANLMPLARVLVSESDPEGYCGFNRFRAQNPNEIAVHEHLSAGGRYEAVLKRPGKMQTYQRRLEKNPVFQREWRDLKRAFAHVHFLDARGIVRRSPIPERNWRRDPPPQFKNPREAFQAAFDIFCWKWFLYGMESDKPLVHKPFYTFTPYGTQLFVPGYLSLDPSRDINWAVFNRVHKARGIERQGETLDRHRENYAQLVRRVKAAHRKAMALGLRGAEYHQYVTKQARLHPDTDPRQIRRLVTARVAA